MALVAVAFGASVPAHGAQWQIGTGQYSKVSGVLHETFDAPSVDPKDKLDLNWSWYGRRAPSFFTTVNDELNCRPGGTVGKYMCITGSSAKSSAVVFDVSGTPADYYGFRWFSIDPPNSVKVFSGSTLIASAAGTDVREANAGKSGGYFQIFADPGALITRVELISAGRSFESDNHGFRFVAAPSAAPMLASPVAGVPEPSTYAMLGAGLAVMGFYARRRKRS
jgi:hypothetical protein